jgi:hypothetical protein
VLALELEVLEVDVPVTARADRDRVCDRLAPRQLIGVVLVRADEDHGALPPKRSGAVRDGLRKGSELLALAVATDELRRRPC